MMGISQTRKRSFRVLMVITLILAGCSLPTQTLAPPIDTITSTRLPETTITYTYTLSPSVPETTIPAPTKTAASLPTDTPSPTQTATRALTLTPLPTSMPTSTPTLLPTLDPTQEYEAIQNFLHQGMDCNTPCFFGIIPGQTTFDQAVYILTWLGASPLESTTQPNIFITRFGFREDVRLSVSPEIENQIVKNLELIIGLEDSGTSGSREWQAFSPDFLVNKYGNPSQVYFGEVASPSPPDSPSENIEYNLILVFDSLDLTVIYGLGLTKDGDILRICPLTDPYESVRIYLGKDPVSHPTYGSSLEEASSLTVDQFSELMRQQSEPACFEVSKEAIP